ncbi:UbiD family decarboxylase [Chloroflexota bacterium]
MINDIRTQLVSLEERGLLVRVKKEINKDTELHPVVRWQYRGGIPEEERKGFLFENVVDSRGKRYGMPVAVGIFAGSVQIYAVGLGCQPEEIPLKWEHALANPVEPVLVSEGAVHEKVHTGEELTREGGGIDMLPVPISTPGFDCAPFFTCANWITKDPETGVRNVGVYRGQVKARNKTGIMFGGPDKDSAVHWRKCQERGIPLEAALVVGPPLVVGYVGCERIPFGVDELSVAGALAGEPLHLVKCKTVDIEVPAQSEIVIEGILPTDYLEPEGPFGESHGHISPRTLHPCFEVKAITHRKNPVFVSWISQLTPSESCTIKRSAYEHLFLKYLRDERRIPSVTRVMMHEPFTNLRQLLIVQMENPTQTDVWRALHCVIDCEAGVGMIAIAVDKDIDPENMDAVFWAMSWRMNPEHDVAIVKNRQRGSGPPFKEGETKATRTGTSALLINATLRDPFPPVSLPKQEYMERGKAIWEGLGLPRLKPQHPWFGYSLGQWTEENEEEARLAVKGDYYLTGDKLASRKVKPAK